MNTWKSSWRLALILGLLGQPYLHSQTLSIPFTLTQSSPAVSFGVDSNGNVLETGPENFSTTLTLSSGSQMLWIPEIGSFRAGFFSGSSWNYSNIGYFSVAMGYDSIASGGTCFAMGQNSIASGSSAVAIGQYATASGQGSVALGYFSVADNGSCSAAIGAFVTASGSYATALGISSTASGFCSTALGSVTTASGNNSTAAGFFTSANSYGSFVIGQYNTGQNETPGTTVSTSSWVNTPGSADPLFEIGDGSGTGSNAADALVVYKDGNVVVSPPSGAPAPPAGTPSCAVRAPAFVTTAPGGTGDIPMFTGN